MPNIETVVRYTADGKNYTWFIPFPFGNEDQVGVNFLYIDGYEREAQAGIDYIINGQSVVAITPTGTRIIIYLKTGLSNAQATYAASVEPQIQVASQATQVMPVEVDTSQAQAEIMASANNSIARLETVAETCENRLNDIESNAQALLNNASGQFAQTQAAVSTCNDSASQAQQYMLAAASASQQAAQAASNICQCNTVADQCADIARGFANASNKSAQESWNACVNAWRAACTASIHHRRPGIATVRRLEDIWGCASGLFLVNPHLTPAPTPFMGIWPATNTDAMTWDGVFFIGPEYPAEITYPPKCVIPEKPEPDFNIQTGDGNAWIPCNHQHKTCCCNK